MILDNPANSRLAGIRSGSRRPGGLAMKTILAPIDFSPITRRVIAEAEKLARLVKGRLILLHVIHPPTIVAETGCAQAAAFMAAAGQASARHLQRLRRTLGRRGLAVAAIGATGYPPRQILEQAKAGAIDYIVIGSHGITSFFDLVVGGTASAVLKQAPCPVVVVPAPAPAPARRPRRAPGRARTSARPARAA
jgi:nucleotide-binding universal stress UspA family protein